MVPPALDKVRKHVLEGILKQLPGERKYPCKPPVPQKQGLHKPSKEVGKKKDIHALTNASEITTWIAWSIDSAIRTIRVAVMWRRFNRS
jgi:hypothetical protein